MVKRALLVGINYFGTKNELAGCINDSHHMQAYLSRNNFTEIKLILEKDATTDGIVAGLEWLTSGLGPGDVIVFHYSGHGSQLPSTTESDGFEEIICPIDLDWNTKVITDDTLRKIFNKVPSGVNTTVILDCCHSGTMLDQTESLDITTDELIVEKAAAVIANEGRYMPPPTTVVRKLKNRSLVDWSTAKDVNENALLIAGCLANQTSADAVIDGIPQGAATASMLKILRTDNTISYKNLVIGMNKFMIENGFEQRPDLDGSSSLYNNTFLKPLVYENEAETSTVYYNDRTTNTNGTLVVSVVAIILVILIILL